MGKERLNLEQEATGQELLNPEEEERTVSEERWNPGQEKNPESVCFENVRGRVPK